MLKRMFKPLVLISLTLVNMPMLAVAHAANGPASDVLLGRYEIGFSGGYGGGFERPPLDSLLFYIAWINRSDAIVPDWDMLRQQVKQFGFPQLTLTESGIGEQFVAGAGTEGFDTAANILTNGENDFVFSLVEPGWVVPEGNTNGSQSGLGPESTKRLSGIAKRSVDFSGSSIERMVFSLDDIKFTRTFQTWSGGQEDMYSFTMHVDFYGTLGINGFVAANFLGGHQDGVLTYNFTAYDAVGMEQQIAQGAFGRPNFLISGSSMQLYDVNYSTAFEGPLELTFGYDPAFISGVFDESDFRVFHWTGTEWEDLGGVVDPDNNTITVITNSLSPFAIAAVPEPETYALMLAGLGLVGFAARRRKQT